MKHRVVQLCLLTAILSLFTPAAARAQFTYVTNNGTITITECAPSTVGDVVIPNTINGLKVTSLGSDAFFQCDNVTSITIGTNVTTLAPNAIFQCTDLASVVFPGSVTNFGVGPVIDCLALTSMSFSSSNTFYTITNNILFNKSLTSLIEFPGGVGGSYTIAANVTNLASAFIGNTLTSISVNATNKNYASTNGVLCDKSLALIWEYPGAAAGSYTVPRTVSIINNASFEYDSGVTSVTIGTNVTTIGTLAFYDCGSLTNFNVNSTNAFFTSTNGVLFDKRITTLIQYPSGLAGSYVIPGTVTNIDEGAFGDAFGLTSVFIPDGVVSIPDEAFYGCENMITATIGTGVKSIGVQAFHDCTSLAGISIPNAVTNIAQGAFISCSSLASVTFGTGLESLGFESFAGCEDLTNACFQGDQPLDNGSVFLFDPQLDTILYVTGTTGWGASYDGIATAPCTACSQSEPAPSLDITGSGKNVIVTWPDIFTGFTLQSATNPFSSATWTTVTPSPADIAGRNTVTNPAAGTRKFYRLFQ